ncbi:hypothetical protein PF005_g33202 [Phytophthora fragariae]|uniref:RNase H type-1 domain-containing protein n=1 Tax=Phytophthora fragariae TaxID=53985 RepID=A0A6A3PEQ0_9STRA|nr:hypothetical protein PF003_g22126 [Phytophthora fragariae]KAE9054337.1 hypothetical protein PF007_g32668 [Phytophthora fragariae]KAE9054909.1 hypothetical protein PF006_g33128 [Phytophthora fragariae]KAE9156462.1 hypothetical protein PF005_g33202 [Phytophthora fragariae]KAE9158158.1 hypothetical protein PF002_g33178 [Phytophthora fragariae]
MWWGTTRRYCGNTPPTASHLKDTYWKSRRAADAAAVVSWTLQQRDQNRAALGFASLAHETEQTVEWTACKNRANGTKWTRITEHIQMDVAQWIAERSKSALYEGAEDKV